SSDVCSSYLDCKVYVRKIDVLGCVFLLKWEYTCCTRAQQKTMLKDESKMKKILIVSMSLFLLVLAGCSPQPLQTIGSTKYFVKVDDAGEKQEIEEADTVRYEYNLVGYDKDGEKKDLLFTAGKELKQGAFLQVYYKEDEVITFEEVEEGEVPEQAIASLNENN